MLDPTELRLYKSDSEVVRYAQGEGFLQMTGEHALVLVDEVFAGRRPRRGRAAASAQARRGASCRTPRRARGAPPAERDKRRYEAFLKLTESGPSARS